MALTRAWRRIPLRWKRLAAVFVGGAAGTSLRLAVDLLPGGPAAWPWGTFVANVSGSLLLGLLLPRLQAAARPTTLRVPLIAIGGLGSYTTFSVFSMQTVRLVEHGRPGLAALYVTTSLVSGLLAALIAMRVTERRR